MQNRRPNRIGPGKRFRFRTGGGGSTPLTPATTAEEIEVTGNGNVILDGDLIPSTDDSTDFGSVVAGQAAILRSYTVRNLGGSPLLISGLSIPTGFTVVDDLPASILPGLAETLTIRLDTDTAGTKSGLVSILNSDTNETPYSWAITGTVDAAPTAPEIDVSYIGFPISNGDPFEINFGSTTVSAGPVTFDFQIENIGDANLTISGITAPTGFAITSGATATILPGPANVHTFYVDLEDTTEGIKSGLVTITNDDADENPFTFAVKGSVYAAPPPPPPPPPPPGVAPTVSLFTVDDTTPQTGQTVTFSWTATGDAPTQTLLDVDGNGTADYTLTTQTSQTHAFGAAATVTPTVSLSNATGSDTEAGPTIVISVAGSETLITKVTIENAEDTDKTNEIVEFGFPTHGSALTTGQYLKVYDDDGTSGHGVGSLITNYQIDNVRTDNDGKRRFAKITAIVPSLLKSSSGSAGKLRKLHVYASTDAPPTGTAITLSDLQAMAGYSSGLAKVTLTFDGTAYSVSLKDIFDGGSTTFGKTTLWYSSQLWRSGPVCTEWVCRAAPRNAGTPHASGDGVHVEFHVTAYKAGTAAVSVGNPITAVRADVLPENADLVRASGTVAHYYYDLLIERATSTTDATLISTNQTCYPLGVQKFAYARSAPAATITLSKTTRYDVAPVGTTTATLSTGSWPTDILHKFIRIPGGNGMAIVTARNSSTQITIETFELFSALSYASGAWYIDEIRHNYNSYYIRRAWIGNRPTHHVALGDNTSAATPTTKAMHDYLASTEMILEYGQTFASVTHTTTSIDALRESDGTIRPIRTSSILVSSDVGEQKMGLSDTGPAPGIGWLPDWQRAGLIKYDSNGKRRIWENGQHFMTYNYVAPRRLSGTPSAGVLPNSPRSDCGSDLYWHINVWQPSTTLKWEADAGHHPSTLYLLYLLSGDYVWFQHIQKHTDFISWMMLLSNSGTYGDGSASTKGPLGASNGISPFGHDSLATRGHAWSLRCLLQCAAIQPDSERTQLMNGKTYYDARVAQRWDGARRAIEDPLLVSPTTGPMHDFKATKNYTTFYRGVANEEIHLCTPWTMAFLAGVISSAKYLGLGDSDLTFFATWMRRFFVEPVTDTGIAWELWSIAFQHCWKSKELFPTYPTTTAQMYQRSCLMGATQQNGWAFHRVAGGTVTLSNRTVGTGRTMTFSVPQFTSGGTGTGAWYVGGIISHPGGGNVKLSLVPGRSFVVGETFTIPDGTIIHTGTITAIISDDGTTAVVEVNALTEIPIRSNLIMTGSINGLGVTQPNPSGEYPPSIPGCAQITSVVSSTVVTVDVLQQFPSTTLSGEVRVPGPHPSDYDGSDEPINARAMAMR